MDIFAIGGKFHENALKEDRFKRVRENVPIIECLIAKTILWNNTKLKVLDEDETRLEEEIETISECCKQVFETFCKEKKHPTNKDTTINSSIKSFRKHSFVQKYLERRKNVKGKTIYCFYIFIKNSTMLRNTSYYN